MKTTWFKNKFFNCFTVGIDFVSEILDKDVDESLAIRVRGTFMDTVDDAESGRHGIPEHHVAAIAVHTAGTQ